MSGLALGLRAREAAHLEVLERPSAARRSGGPRARGRCPTRTSSWAGVFEMSLPSNSTVPSRGWSSPLIVLRVVVLPAPLEPMSVTISPRPTSRSMPWSAWMWP